MAAKSASHWPITLTNGAVAMLNIFLPLALVRFLSLDQMGRYNIFFLYVMLLPSLFFVGGLTSGLYLWAGKYPESKLEIQQSWTLLLGITLTLTAVGFLCVPWAAPRLAMSTQDLRLIFLSIPFGIVASFFEDLLIARDNIWRGAWYGSLSNVLRTLSLLITAWWTRDIEIVFGVFLACVVLRAGAGWLLVRNGGDLKWMFSWEKAKNVLRYAIPVSLAALSAIALSHVDQLILSLKLSKATFALYAMGCLSIPPLEIFEMSVNRVLIPRLSRAFATQDSPHEAAALFADGLSELFRYLLPATLGLILYSKPIVLILFTERYLPAAGFLRVYALSYLLLAFPFGSVARARGDGGLILRTSLIFAGLCTGITWAAANQWNAMGALIAVLTSQFLTKVYYLVHARRSFELPLSRFIPFTELLIQSGIAVAAFGVSLLLRPFFSDSRTWFLVTGPLSTLLYFSGTYAVYLKRHRNAPGPIHVLELAQTLGLGGLERTVYSLARELQSHKGIKVLVATYDHPEGQPSLVPLFAEAKIPLIQWQKGKGFSFRSVIQLVSLTLSEGTRVLHVHDLGPLIYGSMAKVFSLGRVRLVMTLHTLLDIQQNPRYRRYYKFFLRFPDSIIAVSPGVKAGLVTLGVRPERIHVISNGVSFSRRSAPADASREIQTLRKQLMPHLNSDLYASRWILCMARLHAGKGHEVVLETWAALPKEVRAKLGLFFVGQETQKGFADTLREKIRSSPDAERIIWAGPSERPQDWIQSADLFISGSLLEGMPLAPLEAVGSGLPTVLTDIEGHRFLEPWAHYFNPTRPEEGAQKILHILETIHQLGDTPFFEATWEKTTLLRQQWGTSTMASSYIEIFQFN